ncbi:glycosyltransferase [Methylomicrobium sp. Wu6]|uniref:glycosyltransferase n=1 Tax=Methylomicrobium sp. Wu6 TaxID=3107928 RepID=UPI002DD69F70|nr:glycosyltransferase [Methylomicrobium sp. Wu6]
MIVKNETPVLGRLFASVKDIISYYVIVDTGSTDGTPEFIKEWMDNAGIPGEVYIHEWVNFEHNRNQALDYAYKSGQADWLLLIDADEELRYGDPLFYQNLERGTTYSLEKHYGELSYAVTNLIDVSATRWRWQGVVHEYLQNVDGTLVRKHLPDVKIIVRAGEGARSRGVSAEEKFLKDARLLEAELKRHPEDCRSRFYLAQSYRDARQHQKAYANYLLRAEMPGWVEESFVAQYQAGKLAVVLKKPYGEIVSQLLKAYEMRPSRGAEPLHELAMYCRNQGWYAQAYLFAKTGSEIPFPSDILFVEKEIYHWRIFDEVAVAAYWTGRYQESRDACEKALQFPLAAGHVERIQKNLQFALQKLAE